MNYRPQNDVIDPDVSPEGEDLANTLAEQGAEATDHEYVVGEDGRQFVNLEMSEALGRRVERARNWVKPLAVALGIAFVGLTAWNAMRLAKPVAVLPKPTDFQLKQALYLGVLRVEAYRKVHGVTPERLVDAGLPDNGGYAYARIDPTHYQLVFEGDGPRMEYDSDVALERYFGSPKTMLAMGGSQ